MVCSCRQPPTLRSPPLMHLPPAHLRLEGGLLGRLRRQLRQLGLPPLAVVVQLLVAGQAALLQSGVGQRRAGRRIQTTLSTVSRPLDAVERAAPMPRSIQPCSTSTNPHPQDLLPLLHHAHGAAVELRAEAALLDLGRVLLPPNRIHALLQQE